MNLIDGEVTGDGMFEGQGVSLSLGQRGVGHAGRKVVLGVRPDDITVVRDGSPAIAATVGVVEPTGSETLLNMSIGGQSMLGVFKERLDVQPGEQIAVRFDPARVHLFDTETRLRIAD